MQRRLDQPSTATFTRQVSAVPTAPCTFKTSLTVNPSISRAASPSWCPCLEDNHPRSRQLVHAVCRTRSARRAASCLGEGAMLSKYLQRGSSPIDWCESNYSYSSVIAEFGNTVSNLVFLVLPPLLAVLHRAYASKVQPGIRLLWLLFVVVGLSSAYFHATLSLVGQLLDELSILWLLTVAVCMFYPRRFFPRFARGDRSVPRPRRAVTCRAVFGLAAVGGGLVFTGLGMVRPVVNALALMLLGVCVVLLLVVELRRLRGRVYRLGVRSVVAWLLAVACWIADYALCDTLRAINLTFLHAVFHLLSFMAAYTIVVVFSHQYVAAERCDLRPSLSYWPRDNCELGVPYVVVRPGRSQ
ncbi:alkaline ceramidase-like [Bacillus rossius redtenbacheri]|uniref:alkaline ceramidase-like n=1 Tax=Bacillus rossius redtenbacheri TaxID=93214 RepID=UPI002FDCA2BF